MSIDFNAEMENNSPEKFNLKDLPGFMQTLGPATEALGAIWKDRWCERTWRAEPGRFHEGCIDVVGPGGYSLTLSNVSVEVYHCSKFSYFTHDAAHRDLLRRTCFEIATFFRSLRAVYFPEMTPSAFPKDLSATIALLRENFGPPARTIQEIGERFEPGCYYVDDFADLRGR